MLLKLLSPKLQEFDVKQIISAIRACFNLQVSLLSYDKYLTKKHGMGLPPQPERTLIYVEKLESMIKAPVELFNVVDQVLSLMPLNMLEEVRESLNVEILFSWAEKVDRARKRIESLSVSDVRSEDSKKRSVLMIIPSEKQLSVARKNRREWMWSLKTVYGEPAPEYRGWLNELLGIGEVLKSEGVNVAYACSEESREDLIEVCGKKFKCVIIDMPPDKAKIGYARDQSIVWFNDTPIICNMALNQRMGEENVLNEIYYKLNITPVLRPRWFNFGEYLEKAVIEGGNFIMVRGENAPALFTGIGVRGTNEAAIRIISKILPQEVEIYGIPLSGYIKNWKETGTVHLDVALLYGGVINGYNVVFVDPGRIGFYSVIKYNRETETFTYTLLGDVARELGLTLDEPPRNGASRITMTNALNLGGGKLVVDPYNKTVNDYLEKEWGFDLIKVPIPQIEAGGGGIRCVTREFSFP